MIASSARLAAAAALAASLAACATLPSAGRLDGPASAVEVAGRFAGGHVLARVEIGGGADAWLLVDTGAQLSVIDARVASRFSHQATGTSRLTGYGESRLEGRVIKALPFRIAGAEPFAVTTPVVDLSGLDPYAGFPLDGFLGVPPFERFVVEIDYQDRRIVLHDPAAFRPRPGDVRVKLTVEHSTAYVDGEVVLDDGTRAGGRFVLDTGKRNAVSLGTRFVEAHDLMARVPRTIAQRVAGIGGTSEERLGRIASFRIGSITLAAPTVQLSTATVGAAAAVGRAGAIGGDLLRRFTATIDFRSGALYLRPNDAIDEPFEGDMSGLSLAARGPGLRALTVDAVEPGSPAAVAGLRAGDVFEEVDGRSAETLQLWELRERLRSAPGQTIALVVRRDGARVDITLTLTRRI